MTMARTLLSGALLAVAGPALAHHGMGGETPGTVAQGLVSGLLHPVIGLDHLVFVIGLGVLAAFIPRGWILPALFLGLGAVGAGLHIAGANLPAGEALVALSIAFMAGAVYWTREAPLSLCAALCALGGFVHGYALAESIIGAQPAPLWSYLVGLALVQLAISLAVREAVLRATAWKPAIADRALVAASAGILAIGLAAQLWPS